MSPDSKVVTAGLALFDLGRAIATGAVSSAVEVARGIAAIAVTLLPVEDLHQHLDDAAAKRVEIAADLAQEAKFGPQE